MQYETRKSRRRFGRYVVTFVMLIGIIVPLFLAFYYAVLANDRYVTVSQFSVRAATQPSGLSDIISSTTGIPSAAGMLGAFQDAFVIREFVHSQELADRIDNKLDLEGLFSGEHIDWWSRLDEGSTREEKYDYLQHRMSADLDATTGLIKLTVAGFTAEDSLKITQEILVACQELVNRKMRFPSRPRKLRRRKTGCVTLVSK
jgi:capsular polysaccharide transport system permease protein